MKLKEKTNQFYYYAATALFLPLLVLQAIWVRLTVLKLPEPSGERSGQCGGGDKVRLFVLGDSAAAGVGVAKQKDAIAGQLSANLAEKYQVNWYLAARNGFTSSDLIQELALLPSQTFDYVLISVGVNDVTGLTRSHHWSTNIEVIAETLKAKFGAPKIIFTNVPPIQSFKAIPFPLNWWLGRRASKLNDLIKHALKDNKNSTVLTLDLPFTPFYLAEDGVHPSALAYGVWAKQVTIKIDEYNQMIR